MSPGVRWSEIIFPAAVQITRWVVETFIEDSAPLMRNRLHPPHAGENMRRKDLQQNQPLGWNNGQWIKESQKSWVIWHALKKQVTGCTYTFFVTFLPNKKQRPFSKALPNRISSIRDWKIADQQLSMGMMENRLKKYYRYFPIATPLICLGQRWGWLVKNSSLGIHGWREWNPSSYDKLQENSLSANRWTWFKRDEEYNGSIQGKKRRYCKFSSKQINTFLHIFVRRSEMPSSA